MAKIMMLSIAVISLLSICICEGFTFDLIHRDSVHSPTFNHSSTHYQRLAGALHRSYNRVQILKKQSQSLPQPDIVNSGGEFFLKYSLGTPSTPSWGTFDTASDLSWTQCQPCTKCFNQSVPFFTPAKSKTYKRVMCGSPQCSLFQGTTCSKAGKGCKYSETYVDGTFSDGTLAMDTITLGAAPGNRGVSVPNFVFGCGFNNGNSYPSGTSGIIGLGGGKGSLLGQLGPAAQGKFSYCLVPLSEMRTNSSKLKFGESVRGRGTVSTSLVKKVPDTFYYVTLEGISVGNQRLDVESDSKAAEEGNAIVDSGTTMTILRPEMYEKVEKAMRSQIKVKIVDDPQGVLRLCYSSKKDFAIPDVIVHFRGADVKLGRENVFARLSEDLVCLAMAPVDGPGVAIYGNMAQTNFQVGYDLVKRTVSFKVADCAKI